MENQFVYIIRQITTFKKFYSMKDEVIKYIFYKNS